MLRLGLDDSGLNTELGPVIASFNFEKMVNVESMNMSFSAGESVFDQQLGCAIIDDSRHNLKLFIWPNGRCVATDARHPNMVAMSAVFWRVSIPRKQLILVRILMKQRTEKWSGPIVDNHFHLNRSGRF